jgi:hypothetical protein
MDTEDNFSGAIVNELKCRAKNAKVKNPLHKLARITFNFNRRDYGRLRQLIDVLNGL